MAKRTVNFKFELYTKVITPLDDKGIITMLGVDDGGNTYYVESPTEGVNSRWWAEDMLS